MRLCALPKSYSFYFGRVRETTRSIEVNEKRRAPVFSRLCFFPDHELQMVPNTPDADATLWPVGCHLDVRDTSHNWRNGQVMAVRQGTVFIHYVGWRWVCFRFRRPLRIVVCVQFQVGRMDSEHVGAFGRPPYAPLHDCIGRSGASGAAFHDLASNGRPLHRAALGETLWSFVTDPVFAQVWIALQCHVDSPELVHRIASFLTDVLDSCVAHLQNDADLDERVLDVLIALMSSSSGFHKRVMFRTCFAACSLFFFFFLVWCAFRDECMCA